MSCYALLIMYLSVYWRDMLKNCVYISVLAATLTMNVYAQSGVINFDIVGNPNKRLRPGETVSLVAIAEAPAPGILELKIKHELPPFGFDWDSKVFHCQEQCVLRDTLTLSPTLDHGGLYSFNIVVEYTGTNGLSSRTKKINIEVVPELKPEPPFTMGTTNAVCWFPLNAISTELLFFPVSEVNNGHLLNSLNATQIDCQTIQNLSEGIRYGYFLRTTILRGGQFTTLHSDSVYSTQDNSPPSTVALNDFSVNSSGSVALRWLQPADAISYVDQFVLYRKSAQQQNFAPIDTLPVFPVNNITPQNYIPVRIAAKQSVYVDENVPLLGVPRVIDGTVMIKTAARDRWSESQDFLSFELETPAIIYIAFDKRTIKPQWLERKFVSTRNNIRTSKNPEGLLRLWSSRVVYQPGRVTLGGNFAEVDGQQFDSPEMYVVFVKPVEATFPYMGDSVVSFTDSLGEENDQQAFEYRIDAVDAAGNVSEGQQSAPVILDLHGRCRPIINRWFTFQNVSGETFGKGLSNLICVQDPATQSECVGFRETDSLRFQSARANPELFDVHRQQDIGTLFFDSGWIASSDRETAFCYSFDFLPPGRDPNLVNGQTYYYRVQAKDVHGNVSAWSDTVSAIQDVFPPEDIRNLQAQQQFLSDQSNGCISLSWQPSFDPISGVGVYYVYRSDDNGASFFVIDSLSAQQTSYCDSLSRIGSNRIVQYKVAAVDRVGNLRRLVDSSEMVSLRALVGPQIELIDTAVVECPPGRTAVRNDTVFVQWAEFDNTDAFGYQVAITDPSGELSQIVLSSGASTRATSPLRGDDGIYTIRVRAFYGNGDFTIYSNTITLRKKTTLLPVEKIQAIHDPLPTGDILLSWFHPDGDEIVEFRIFNWREGETKPTQASIVLPGDSLRWRHSFLEDNLVTYRCNYYSIQAVDCLGLVSSMDTIAAQHPNRPPVFDPGRTVITNNDITVCWNRPSPRVKDDDNFEAEVSVFLDIINGSPLLHQRVFNRTCFTLFGAAPRHNYIFQVREIILDNLNQACADSFKSGLSTPLIVPFENPPQWVAFEIQALPVRPAANTGEAFLSWQSYSASNVNRFQVKWSAVDSTARGSLLVFGADTLRVAGLNIDRDHQFSVYAIDNLDQVSDTAETKVVNFRPRWLFTPKIEKFTPNCFRDSVTIQWHWVNEALQPVGSYFGADSIIIELSIDPKFIFRKTTTSIDLRTEFMFKRSVHYPFVNNQNNRLYARSRAKDRWNHSSPWSTEYMELGVVSEIFDDIPPAPTAISVDSTKAPIFGGPQQLNVFLHWQEVEDNCSGIGFYEILRDGAIIGYDTSLGAVHHFVDRGLKTDDRLLAIRWSVNAVDRAGNRQTLASTAGIPLVMEPPTSAECLDDTTFCSNPVETSLPGQKVFYFVEGARFVELFGNPETNIFAGPQENACVNFDVPWETINWRVKVRVDKFESAWSDTFFCALTPQSGTTLAKFSQAVSLPTTFDLKQNYPNPFNPETIISYAVPVSARKSGHIVLEIYNISGQRVRTLVDEEQEPGEYSIVWDGRDDAGAMTSSGVFIYRMRAHNFIATRKMIFLK